MAANICLNCFKVKGDYDVCPHCGYVEGTPPEQIYYLKPGTILENRYIIGTSIGFGGFGITYKAYDSTLSIVVAIKEFYPAGLVNRAAGDEKVGIFSGEKEAEFKVQLERFMDEARNMAVFSKEKDIVNVYHYFQANGTAYTIMEYIDGALLKDFLKENGKMEVKDALSFFIPILNAVEKIHNQGIIHKDISPDNIFLMGNESVKIFDFGAARFPDGQQENTFSVVIKSGYAPPEQYRAQYEQGFFMDIYALGAVFYEMVTGVKPDEGSDRAVKDELELPSKRGINIDKNLEKIIMKAMAVNPKHRFQSIAEFRDCIIKNRTVALPGEEEKQKVKKRAAIISVASILLVAGVIGGAGGYYWYTNKDKLNIAGIKEDAISVWLRSDETSDVAKLLTDDMKKNCPEITLDITEVKAAEYADKLAAAEKEGALPDVFCTDYLNAKETDKCAEINKIYNTLDAEEYPYFTEYVNSTEAQYQVPMGIQIAVAYENYGKYEAAGTSTDETLTPKQIQEMNQKERTKEEKFDRFANADKKLKLIAGDLTIFQAVSEVTVQAVPSQEFAAVPVVNEEGALDAVYVDNYGVNKESSNNKQSAAMTCIYLMLGKNIQQESFLRNYEGIPVSKAARDQYQEIKLTGYLDFVNQYLDNMAIDTSGKDINEVYFNEL